jgi:hypothetical protein
MEYECSQTRDGKDEHTTVHGTLLGGMSDT